MGSNTAESWSEITEITLDFAMWRSVVTFPRAVSLERWEQKTDWSGFKNE